MELWHKVECGLHSLLPGNVSINEIMIRHRAGKTTATLYIHTVRGFTRGDTLFGRVQDIHMCTRTPGLPPGHRSYDQCPSLHLSAGEILFGV